MLFQMYSDSVNKLCLLFLRPVLQEVNATSKGFEGEDTDSARLLQDLTHLIESTSKIAVLPTARVNPTKEDISSYVDTHVYLGSGYEKYRIEAQIPQKEVCGAAGLPLVCSEACQRVAQPSSQQSQNSKDRISVVGSRVPESVKGSIVPLSELLRREPSTIEKIVCQWRKLGSVSWHDTTSTTSFWYGVLQYRDSAGVNPFQELSDLALAVLSMPHSNTEVERFFNQVSVLKTKQRNKIETETLSALLSV